MEEKRNKEKMKDIRKMEKMEWDLIQKLQVTQNVQKDAFRELEEAMKLETREFQEKYMKKGGVSLPRIEPN